MTRPEDRYEPLPLDWRAKGLPALRSPMDAAAVRDAGWSLFDGTLLLPTMVLRREALEHDIELMARYADERGVSFAPHGKTTMSPQIWRAQLDAGAWAITVATPWQARVATKVGVPRILIANEIVDAAGLTWLGETLDDEGPEIICQADSIEGVERMSTLLGVRRRRLRTLVEVGLQGGRAGVRTVEDGLAVARAIAAAPALELSGVTSFEGVVTGDTAAARTAIVGKLMRTIVEVAGEIEGIAAADGADELVLSGGGSTYFITVIDELSRAELDGLPSRVVIRSGCTVTHDHDGYDVHSPFGTHAPPGAPRLRPAIEVWAPVLSRPEPSLAIVGAGKRDLPYDAAMPRPIRVRRIGEASTSRLSGATVDHLNDQHAFVEMGPDVRLAVGDLVAFGISHPCSAFDRWRTIPVVDAEDRIVDVYETIF